MLTAPALAAMDVSKLTTSLWMMEKLGKNKTVTKGRFLDWKSVRDEGSQDGRPDEGDDSRPNPRDGG